MGHWQRTDGELCSAGSERALHVSSDDLDGGTRVGKKIWTEFSRIQGPRASGPIAFSKDGHLNTGMSKECGLRSVREI
jgi:hypothetical protein